MKKQLVQRMSFLFVGVMATASFSLGNFASGNEYSDGVCTDYERTGAPDPCAGPRKALNDAIQSEFDLNDALNEAITELAALQMALEVLQESGAATPAQIAALESDINYAQWNISALKDALAMQDIWIKKKRKELKDCEEATRQWACIPMND